MELAAWSQDEGPSLKPPSQNRALTAAERSKAAELTGGMGPTGGNRN